MPTKELTGHDEVEFEKLDAEIRLRWCCMKPKLDQIVELAVKMRDSKLYLAKYQTYEEYSLATFERSARAMEALIYRERKKAKRIADSKPTAKVHTSCSPKLEYVGTENDKPMPARKVPGATIEHTTPPPMPHVVIRTPCVPITVTDRINELVREAMRLSESGPIAFTDRPFRHFMSQLLGLQKLVQPDLPGWGEDFKKPPEPKAKPITALDIYAAYPLKVGKPVALKAIEKQMKTDSPEHLLERTKLFAQTRNGDLEFVPHPSTWFNQQRFNDEPETWKAKELAGNGHSSAFTLKTQLDAVETKIKRIRNRGVEGPFGIKLSDMDRPEYQSLCAKKRELVNKIATLT